MEINRGEIWFIGLNPVIGHEQAGKRPAIVISDDLFNHGASGMAIVLPITSKYKGIPSHVEINADILRMKSYIKTEDIRAVSTKRFINKIGKVDNTIIENVEEKLKLILGFN
jgi:mRNA interferase MazF